MLLFQLISGNLSIIGFLAIIAGILLGVSLHEYAHALAAYRNGDDTAKYMGRLTINPLAHLDPTGTIMLLLVGIGWGKPVPINPRNFASKGAEIEVSLAGIVTNLIIAFVLGTIIRFSGGQLDSLPTTILYIIMQINLILAVFNLIPIPPLDGSHLLEYFMTEEQKIQFQTVGPSILIALLVLSFVGGFSIFSSIVGPVVEALSRVFSGV
ncbi:MAG TPA: site-2 protease family protein [bacterium]|nr:site-2 protease family protein [bacterium]